MQVIIEWFLFWLLLFGIIWDTDICSTKILFLVNNLVTKVVIIAAKNTNVIF